MDSVLHQSLEQRVAPKLFVLQRVCEPQALTSGGLATTKDEPITAAVAIALKTFLGSVMREGHPPCHLTIAGPPDHHFPHFGELFMRV